MQNNINVTGPGTVPRHPPVHVIKFISTYLFLSTRIFGGKNTMVKTKGLDRTAQKWKNKVAGAQGDYVDGVNNPKRDWASETAKAEGAYEQGVQRAISNKSFGKGVGKAGTAKWQKGAVEKGPGRWAEGVAKAEDEYRQGMGEVIQVIEGTQLPPRGPKGDPKNYDRSRVLGQKLHNHFKGK